jgi:hypothetical protein
LYLDAYQGEAIAMGEVEEMTVVRQIHWKRLNLLLNYKKINCQQTKWVTIFYALI